METKYLKQSEGQIAFDDMGKGPLVICTPSMGDLRSEYRFLAPQLALAGFRVVSMDVRGHGETSPTWADYSVAGIGYDLIALTRALDAGPAILIGVSMAAGAAVWAAAEAPELVKGLVLISPFVRGGGDWQSKLLSILFIRPWGPALWRRYYQTLYPSHKPTDFSQYCEALYVNLTESGRVEALGRMLRASKAASEERLQHVNKPTLVIAGSKDPDFKHPEAEAEWVANRLHGQYQMITNAGHYPHAEMPEVTGQIVSSFLQSLK